MTIFALMKMKERILSLIVVSLMMIAAAIIVNKTVFGQRLDTSGTNVSQTIKENNSDNVSIGSDGKVVINTSGLPGTIDGYAGAVPLNIYISDGVITEIEPLPNTETPGFFSRASVLFKEWIGKTPEEAEKMRVDGISGATYSSDAIINNVRVGLSSYDGGETAGKDLPVKVIISFIVILAACVLPLFVKNRIYHFVQLIANIAILGFWCGHFLDYALILRYLSGGFTWPMAISAILMLIAAFIYPLFGKPQYYCNHICPLGAAQELMAEICGYKIRIPKRVLKGLDWFRKIIWAVLMLLLWTDCLTGWLDLELFRAFQIKSAPVGIIIAAGVFVLLSAVVSRPYCRFVCPTGSLFKRAENIG